MIELIGGGARSGKSRYALEKAGDLPGRHTFIATAEAKDNSMADRIQRHQRERDERWTLIEEPLELASKIAQQRAGDIVLVDCLTLWLSNWLCSEKAARWTTQKQEFLTALQQTSAEIFLITNEVGLGVIPVGQLSRDFVDQSGWLHQDIAALANRVTMVTFGIPQSIK